jgi:dTMP kinase
VPLKHRFIVLDGCEGAGKTTQLGRLAEALRAAGEHLLVTIEPGGTTIGNAVREILLSPNHAEMTPLTEIFLFCASRAQHCDEVIRPALEAGQIVLCDRFSASTFAYQGHAGGAGVELVERLDAEATRGLVPDMTIILDLPPEEGMRRKFGHGPAGDTADRIERNQIEFHRNVREGFHEYARRYARRTAVLDASVPEAKLFEAICEAIGLSKQ